MIKPFPVISDPSGISGPDMSKIQKIARNIVSRNCLLFMGAGVNACPDKYRAYYPKEHQPPMGTELCDILIKNLGKKAIFNDHNDKILSRVAEHYKLEMGDRLEMHEVLIKCIQKDKKPSPLLYLLASLPFEYIMTTNYDRHFETALEEQLPAKSPKIGVYQRTTESPTAVFTKSEANELNPFFFKVHGDIYDRDSIVISDEDFVQFLLRMRDKEKYDPIPRVFRDALATKSTLFIGNRLMDYNIRLLYKIISYGKDDNTMPRNYAIDPYPDPLIIQLVPESYHTIYIVLDAWTVLPIIKAEVERLSAI